MWASTSQSIIDKVERRSTRICGTSHYYSLPPHTGYAESADGIHWTKPDLGLIEYEGSRENNLVWPIPGGRGRSLSIFRDANPAALPEERYKAIGGEPTVGGEKQAGIYVLLSPDGLRWRLREPVPMIVAPRQDPQFDSHNIALWDSAREQYVVYARGWYREGAPPLEGRRVGEELNRILVELPSEELRRFTRIRDIRRYTSPDFRTCSGPEYIDLGSTPWNITISPDVRIRRGVLREDGFVSLRAPYQGGSVLTKPLRFSGAELRINYSTSAAGSIREEIQSASGKALAGYGLEDCPQIFGDETNRLNAWKTGSDLAHLAGQAIRLKFEIKDGDLYSLCFE